MSESRCSDKNLHQLNTRVRRSRLSLYISPREPNIPASGSLRLHTGYIEYVGVGTTEVALLVIPARMVFYLAMQQSLQIGLLCLVHEAYNKESLQINLDFLDELH